MQKVQIHKISEEIIKFIENLTYNGLNLVSNENIRQIEFFLQNSSQVGAYRLATSLRYLHVELKRFLKQSPAFNIDRYIFFLSNCWLLSRAFEFRKNKIDDEFYEYLMGKSPDFKVIKRLKLRLVGMEKIFLEGTIFGVILYFLSLFGKTKGKIFKLNLMQPPKGVVNPEILLTLEIPHHNLTFKELLFKDFFAKNLLYSEKEKIISFNNDEEGKIYQIENTRGFPLDLLENYDFYVHDLYTNIVKYETTPFDMPTSVFNYILLKDVKIIESNVEGSEEDLNRTATHVFKLTHARGYPIYSRIQDKPVNQVLIEKLNVYKTKKMVIENLFGKLLLERGQLSVFPLSVIINNTEAFICASNIQKDYREIMNTLYKQ